MKKPICLSLILDKLFFNAFTLDALTVHRSSRFHLLATLFDRFYVDIHINNVSLPKTSGSYLVYALTTNDDFNVTKLSLY